MSFRLARVGVYDALTRDLLQFLKCPRRHRYLCVVAHVFSVIAIAITRSLIHFTVVIVRPISPFINYSNPRLSLHPHFVAPASRAFPFISPAHFRLHLPLVLCYRPRLVSPPFGSSYFGVDTRRSCRDSTCAFVFRCASSPGEMVILSV